MAARLEVIVNDVPINTEYFVAKFIVHTVSGMVESLEGTRTTKDLDLSLENGRLAVTSNGEAVPVNEFVTRIFITTLEGILSPLKGVTTPIRKVHIRINR